MRTTLTVDDDLMERLTHLAHETHQSFKAVLNQTLRRGLAEVTVSEAPPFHYEGHAGNLRAGIDSRRLNELAWELDDERFRGR